jgi:Lon protease-like protein
VLTGLRRSRVSGVAQQAPYVTVTLEAYDEPPSSEQLAPLAQQVLNRYLTTVEPHLTGTTWLQHLAIPDDVVNFVAGRAGFTCREERALLELPNAEARAWVLLQRLEGARKRQPKRGAHLALGGRSDPLRTRRGCGVVPALSEYSVKRCVRPSRRWP